MPASHESFILWLILSMGIHAATLTLWPMPPSWKVGHNTHLVVDLRSSGSGTLHGQAGSSELPAADKPSPRMSPAAPKAPIQSEKTRVIKPVAAPAKKAVSRRQAPAPSAVTTPSSSSMASAIPAASAAGANADTGSNASSGQDAGAGQPSAGSSLVGGEPGQAGGFGVGSNGHGEAGVKAKKGVTRATPLGYGDNPAMPYPRTARRRGWQGEVLLRVSVSENGQVLSARVEKSSGYGILDDTALQQVSNWRFRPAQRNGIPRQDTVIVPVHFQLHAP